jgi:hypothetical protein
MLIHQDDGSCRVDELEDAAALWNLVEDNALEQSPVCYSERMVPDHPTIRDVVFIESKDGKQRALRRAASSHQRELLQDNRLWRGQRQLWHGLQAGCGVGPVRGDTCVVACGHSRPIR